MLMLNRETKFMGMDGGVGEGALISALLGSSLLSGITAPQGQKLSSFDDGGIDPRSMMGEGKGLIEDFMGGAIDEANRPVTLKTTVNPLPSFKGGGLPMAISAPGMDANRLNPALRTTGAPVQLTKRHLPGEYDPTHPGGPVGPPVNPNPHYDGPSSGNPPPPPDGPGGTTPVDPMEPQGRQAGGDPLAAIQLLKSAHRTTF